MFPLTDPQFWLATLITAAAVLFILRALLPKRARRRGGKGRPTTLTVERRPVE